MPITVIVTNEITFVCKFFFHGTKELHEIKRAASAIKLNAVIANTHSAIVSCGAVVSACENNFTIGFLEKNKVVATTLLILSPSNCALITIFFKLLYCVSA